MSGPGGRVEQAAVWGRTPSGNAKVTGAGSLQLPTVTTVTVTDQQGRPLATAHL